MKSNLPTPRQLRQSYEVAKSLGSAMLACNAILIPEGYKDIHILLQNFQRPIITNHDSADVDYAGGLQAHVAGVVKTNFEGQWTLIETEAGAISKFAESIVNDHGGILPLARVYDGFMGDGDNIKANREYELIDSAITFGDGGGDIDSASRSQILQIQANCRYNYFGQTGKIGGSASEMLTSTFVNALKNFGDMKPSFANNNVTIYG